MEHTYLTGIHIIDVRHLHDIQIPLSRTERKHLVLTGKNGCGKTSVLKSLNSFLEYMVSDRFQLDDSKERIAEWKDKLRSEDGADRVLAHQQIKIIEENARRKWNDGCIVHVNLPTSMREKHNKGQFILAYYSDSHKLELQQSQSNAAVELKQVYSPDEHPAKHIGEYLLSLKTTQAFAKLKGDKKKVREIDKWFAKFEKVLRGIYENQELELKFDLDTRLFTIHIPDRHPFPLDCMSMGYAAIFDIVGDLMMRMENQHSYELEGIVMIDEIETHLHVELQRAIVPILTELFPNLQFILTTHSPFILTSTPNSVVYDLEADVYVEDGLTDYPYDTIVRSYFETDLLSRELREKLNRYRELLSMENRRPHLAEIKKLENYLDNIPWILSPEFAAEYRQIKLRAGR